jgi:hypothetical protein
MNEVRRILDKVNFYSHRRIDFGIIANVQIQINIYS